MNIKEVIEKEIKKAVKSLYRSDFEVSVELPKEKQHGDYSTNIALLISRQLKKSPIEIAQKIVDRISVPQIFEKIEVAAPGFINFYLTKEVFINNVKEILKNKKAKGSEYGRRIIIEYTDPNPFKEFHIGHLMSNAIGESISRIFEFQGAKVKRANYQGDVGLHVAKAIWGKINNPSQSWQSAYVSGATKYDQDEKAKQEMIELNGKIYKRSDKNINRLYNEGKKESLKKFEKIYKELGTRFDYYFFESQMAGVGKKVVEDGLKKGTFKKGEKGAIVFRGEQFGLHTRVFINSEGLPTYEAKELALAKEKYKKYQYGGSVVVTGNEINEYFKVLLCAMKQIFPDLAEKTKHIGHGMMRLPEGKMSSRTGKVITFESLLDEVEKLVEEKIKDRDLSQAEKTEITEKVAIGALKYSILKQSIGSDIIYDFDKSISFEGDSGPYLQYAFARAQSVLRKAKGEKLKASLKVAPKDIGQLEKMMIYFPEVIEKAGKEYQPHFIVLYLTELAREFNTYYANNKIVDAQDEFSSYKIALTEAFVIIMKNGLWLLGISAPIKM